MARRALLTFALLAGPALLLAPAALPHRALLPADLLAHFQPWGSQPGAAPAAHWDPLVWDGIAQFYPWRLFAAESLRAGVLPLWNPYQFSGTPFLANAQSAVLYPPNLLFLLFPVAYAFFWSALFHLLLAGAGAYLLLRRMRVSRTGALCGAVVWQLNSFYIAWIHLPTVLCTTAWLPFILLLSEQAVVSGRARSGIFLGAVLALSYLGGHPQAFLFVALLSTGYLISRAFARDLPLSAGRRIIRLLSVGAPAALVAAGLAAAQLLPTLDLVGISHRAAAADSYRAYLTRAILPQQTLGLLLPHPFGHPGEGTYFGPENYADYVLYLGIVALGLALWAAATCRTWHARFFAWSALLALLITLGTPLNWPLYRWLPGLAGAGGPARFQLLTVFSLSMLAALGAGALIDKTSAPHPRVPRGLLAVLGLLGLLVAAWWAVTASAGGPANTAGEAMRAFLLLSLAILAVVAARFRPLRAALPVALAIILAADLLLAAQGHLHVVPRASVYAEHVAPAPTQGRLLGNAADWPLTRFPQAAFPPNAATVYHRRDVMGYDSLYLATYRDFAALLQGADPSPPANGNLLLARLGPKYPSRIARLAGIDTIISPVPIAGLEPVQTSPFYLYRDPLALPRAWVAESVVFTPTHRDAIHALEHPDLPPGRLIITGPEAPLSGTPGAPPSVLRVNDPSPNTVSVDLSPGAPAYLFLADAIAPGWHAYCEGGELAVRETNVAFRSVLLPAHTHSVVFRYQPTGFRVGLFLSLVALAFITGAAVFFAHTGRRA